MYELKLKIQNHFIQKKIARRANIASSQVRDKTLAGIMFSSGLKLLVLCFFGMIILFPFFLMISLSFFDFHESQSLQTEFHLLPKYNIVDVTKPDGTQYKALGGVAYVAGTSASEQGGLQNLPWQEIVQNTYKRAFTNGYLSSLLVTSLNVFVSITIKIFVTMMMGYAFSIRNWRFKNLFWFILLALLVLPEVALLSGQLRVVFALKLNSQYFGFILTLSLPFAASVFNAIMYRSAFEQIPGRIKEVSLIDGAGGAKYLFKIAIPMVMPTTLTVIILTALASWNAYLWPSLVATSNSDAYRVLSVWLFSAGVDQRDPNSGGNVLANVRMAASIIAILPMFIVYFLFRKRIMGAISRQGNAIKG